MNVIVVSACLSHLYFLHLLSHSRRISEDELMATGMMVAMMMMMMGVRMGSAMVSCGGGEEGDDDNDDDNNDMVRIVFVMARMVV